MIEVVGVAFRNAGKVYYFSPGSLPVKRGLHVIVETSRGTEYGTVVGQIREIDEADFSAPIKPILRIATKRDDEQEAANREKEAKAFRICKEKIEKHKLDMKLIGVEYTFDSSKVLFYFTADGRVDFRELVKDLAGVFRTRIELRQIGVRDETKILGGIGVCGRPLCCHVYLSDFAPVSIKMAKEQNLSLNPTKISGVCGRLMCCLKNEEDTYEYLNKLMPYVGDVVQAQTEDGPIEGEVHSVNVLRQTVKVLFDDQNGDREIQEFKVDELTFEPRKGRGKNRKKNKQVETPEEIAEEKELEKLIEADEEDLAMEKAEEAAERAEGSGRRKRGDRSENRKGRDNRKGGGRDRGESRGENRQENRGSGRNGDKAGGNDRNDNRGNGRGQENGEGRNDNRQGRKEGNGGKNRSGRGGKGSREKNDSGKA